MQKLSLSKLLVVIAVVISMGFSATLFIYADKMALESLNIMVLEDLEPVNVGGITYSDVDITAEGDTPIEEDEEAIEEEIIKPTLPPMVIDESESKPVITPPVTAPEEEPAVQLPEENTPEVPEAPAPPENNPEAPIETPTTEIPNEPSKPEVEIPDANPNNGSAEYGVDLNQYVLNTIKTYTIGNYPYLLNNDYMNYNGVTMNLYYQNKLLLKAHPSGSKASHCVGLTFEILLRAMQERNKALGISADDINGMSYKNMYDMALIWFVSSGNKKTNNIQIAVEKYGIGRGIYNLNDAKAGDFIDISRENNTGHTGVFINWVKEGERIIGVKYWSTQASTKGIDYRTEYFNVKDATGKKYGSVMYDMIYVARVGAVKDYRSIK